MTFYRFFSVYLATDIAEAGGGLEAEVGACDRAGIWVRVPLLLVEAAFGVLPASSSSLRDTRFWQELWQVRGLGILLAGKVLKSRLLEIFLFFFRMSWLTCRVLSF